MSRPYSALSVHVHLCEVGKLSSMANRELRDCIASKPFASCCGIQLEAIRQSTAPGPKTGLSVHLSAAVPGVRRETMCCTTPVSDGAPPSSSVPAAQSAAALPATAACLGAVRAFFLAPAEAPSLLCQLLIVVHLGHVHKVTIRCTA